MNNKKNEKLKKFLLIIYTILTILIVFYLFIFLGVILMNHYMYDNEEKSSHFLYKDKIVESIGEKNIVELKNIFDFDFDYIYMPSDENFSSEDLKRIFDIEYNIEEVKSACEVLHIYFIKDNKVVHEFNYFADYLTFYPLDEVILAEDAIFDGECNKDICSLTLVDKK